MSNRPIASPNIRLVTNPIRPIPPVSAVTPVVNVTVSPTIIKPVVPVARPAGTTALNVSTIVPRPIVSPVRTIASVVPTVVPRPAPSPVRTITPVVPTTVPRPAPSPVRTITPVVPTAVPRPVASPIRVVAPVTAPRTLVIRPTTTVQPPTSAQQVNYGQLTDDDIVEYAVTLNKGDFDKLLAYLDEVYHNDESDISDETYDELIDIYEAKFGQRNVIGAEPRGERVDLPYYLGSLAKVKEEKTFNNYLSEFTGPYLVQDKVDGLTWLIWSRMVNGRRVTSIFTRGGGKRGMDVSHFLTYTPLPPINRDIAIRVEVVMHKDVFARVGTGYKNARNLVSGIVSSKKKFKPEFARLLSVYAYRIMDNTGTPEDDINELRAMGFLVPNPVITSQVNMTMLTEYYEQRKQQAPYEMDGLVVYQNQYEDYPYDEKPRHVVAFKVTGERAEVIVTGVTWNASRLRSLRPIVNYQPVFLSGGELQNATGYNAKFIVDNNIGPGARIIITRSGDTIPDILAVISPGPSGPMLPDMEAHGAYGWDANQTHLVLFEDNQQVVVRRMLHFLRTIDVKNSGPARVASLVVAGIDDISKLLRVTPQQLAGLPGIGPGISNQLYNDIRTRITNIPLARIMDASGIFPNVGERRFDNILAVYPTLLAFAYEDTNRIAEVLRNVPGINTLADEIAPRLPVFATWLRENPMITVTVPTPVVRGGITVVFSGFRDKQFKEQLEQRGIRVASAVSGNTNFLIMKSMDLNSLKGKANDAQKFGVELITRDDAILRFLS